MPTLDWIGKKAVVGHHKKVPFHLLRCNDALSVGPPGSGNLLIQADNLIALKALLPYYAGQVKCIYIDPPYNTGNESWVYNDNVNSPRIRDWLGMAVGKEFEDLSRHDKWLCMMYPRLVLLRDLLREDGSIFVSIDDNEVHSLRLMMDEIFGKRNFKSCITWQRKYSVSNNFKGIATIVDYILVYQKSDKFKNNLLPRTGQSIGRYTNPDNDPRGPWKAVDYLNQASPKKRPNLCYDIVNPNTGLVIKNTTKAWKYEYVVHQQHIAENKLWWGLKGTNTVPALKLFLSAVRKGMTPHNWWPHEDTGHTDEAKKEIDGILGANKFDTPKPVRLITRILQIATNPGDIVLDSFAGSGTTGHAVLAMNKQFGHARRFILVEMDPEIAQLVTKERLRRVALGYTNTKGNKVVALGGSFRFCELGASLFDSEGRIASAVNYEDLAHHVFFIATGEPLPKNSSLDTPLLGVADGVAVYLLFNGILGDKSVNGGNVLTRAILASLPSHEGTRIMYGNGCQISSERLRRENIIFRQIPYELRVS